jgi:hypothetical protein
MSDEHFYQQAAEEMRIGTADPGLALKAFAKGGGDERKSHAVYLELRVAQLKTEVAAELGKQLAQKTAKIGGKVYRIIAPVALVLGGLILAIYLLDQMGSNPDKMLPQLIEIIKPAKKPIKPAGMT